MRLRPEPSSRTRSRHHSQMVCADEDGAVIVTAAKVYANQWGGGRVEACCIHCLRVRRDVLLVTTRFFRFLGRSVGDRRESVFSRGRYRYKSPRVIAPSSCAFVWLSSRQLDHLLRGRTSCARHCRSAAPSFCAPPCRAQAMSCSPMGGNVPGGTTKCAESTWRR